jgi:hypothetical protein
LQLVTLKTCVFEFELNLLELLLKILGALAMMIARGRKIADADLQGFALGFTCSGLGLPGIARAEKFGDENAWRSQERGSGHEAAYLGE